MYSVNIPRQELKQAGYELFILITSLLAVVNTVLLLLPVLSEVNDQVLRTINLALALLFLLDFFVRLSRAESRLHYFFIRFGWADLLSAMPFPIFQLLRLPRIVRSSNLLRQLGGRKTWQELAGNRASGALFSTLLLGLLLVQIASMLIVSVESGAPTANIKTGGDAIWWAYVTITTIGYGDLYPVTPTGRWLGVLVMSVGVGLFGVLTGFLANAFLGRPQEQREEELVSQMSESIAGELSDSLAQLSEMQSLLREQEHHFTRLRERILALEQQLREQKE